MPALRRRTLLHFLAAGAAAAALPAPLRAAPPRHRVFVVLWRGPTDLDRGMRDYLARAGLPVEYILRDAGQSRDTLARIVAEIRATRPDLVYVVTTEATLGVLGTVDDPDGSDNVPPDIPVVFAAVGDPLAAGLVRSLPLSGRNATGVIHLAPVPVQYEAMLSLFTPKRIAVLYNEAESYGHGAVAQLRPLCDKSGIELVTETPLDGEGRPQAALIRPALARLAARKPDVLYLPSTSFFIPQAGAVTAAALDLGLPTFSGNEPMIRQGSALAGLVASFHEVGQFAGYKIERILTGQARAEAIPVESLSRFSLLINMRVARRLAVYPPITMLRYAEVIDAP
ncbi:MAG: hypothetical protein RLZZ501_760 [Pseudomonadota bacterium]|jgi:putative ABC transport system substrate-binding protein